MRLAARDRHIDRRAVRQHSHRQEVCSITSAQQRQRILEVELAEHTKVTAMFNSSRRISKAAQKQLSRSRQRRLSFECFETRSMLSAAPIQLDPDLLIAVSGQLANLH